MTAVTAQGILDAHAAEMIREKGNVPHTEDVLQTDPGDTETLPVSQAQSKKAKKKSKPAPKARNPSTRSRNPSAKLVAIAANAATLDPGKAKEKITRASHPSAVQKEGNRKRKAEGGEKGANKRKKN